MSTVNGPRAVRIPRSSTNRIRAPPLGAITVRSVVLLVKETRNYTVVVVWSFFLKMMRRLVHDVEMAMGNHPRKHERVVRGEECVVHAPGEERRRLDLAEFSCEILPIATR